MRRYVVQKIARTGTTIFKLERHRVGCVRGRSAASLDESADIEARVFAAQGKSEVHRDLCAGVDVVDALDDFSDKLEMLAGQCPLLCLGHLNNRHGWGRVKNYLTFLKSWVR